MCPSCNHQSSQSCDCTNNDNNNHHVALFATRTTQGPQTGAIMRLKIKEVARHLVQNENVNMPVFLLKWQLAQQPVRSSKRLPGALRTWIAKETFFSVPSTPNQKEALKEELALTALPIAEAKETRPTALLLPLPCEHCFGHLQTPEASVLISCWG